jgi:hypothetical protein
MIKDRRSGMTGGIERLDVNIERLNGKVQTAAKQGTISDISRQGCFVLCSGEVEDGEYITIFLPLATK